MPLYTNVVPDVSTPPNDVTAPIIDTASIYSNNVVKDPIINYIEGSTWSVDYYGQHIGDDDIVTNFGDILDPTLRQYQKIQSFELRVNNDLTLEINPDNGLSALTGTSNVYPVIAPIPGDMIIGPIGDGLLGMFEVSSVNRKSMFKDSAWEIRYSMIEYVSTSALDALNALVVSDLVFDVSLLGTAAGPIRTLSENHRAITKDIIIEDMLARYYDEFYSLQHGTFILPGVGDRYDPFLIEFWNTFIGTKMLDGNYPRPNGYDARNAIFKRDYKTVWDAVAEQSRPILKRAVSTMRSLSTSSFGTTKAQFSLSATGIDYVIQPTEIDGLAIVDPSDDPSDEFAPYIFSTAFYTNAGIGQSPIEIQMNKAIDRELLAFIDISPIYDDLENLSGIERFYHIPFLIAVLSITR